MTRYEFIDVLQRTLAGNVSSGVVNENIRYYEDYIDTKLRIGESEEDVIESLGDPRLLAKTIMEASKNDIGSETQGYEYENVYDENGQEDNRSSTGGHIYRMPGWLLAVIVIAVIILIIGAVTSLLSALLPILLPVLLVVFIYRLIKGRT